MYTAINPVTSYITEMLHAIKVAMEILSAAKQSRKVVILQAYFEAITK